MDLGGQGAIAAAATASDRLQGSSPVSALAASSTSQSVYPGYSQNLGVRSGDGLTGTKRYRHTNAKVVKPYGSQAQMDITTGNYQDHAVYREVLNWLQGGTGGGSYPLNDTGIDWCADEDTNFLSCPQAGYPWQDAQDGRDAHQNNPNDGHAGFSFTKLDANGNPLSASAASWSCVRDNHTGLVWEVKTNDGGLHDRDDRFNWYNTDPSTNGGFAGYADDDGAICDGYVSGDPSTYCNTQAYVARVNDRGLCGARDWRLPSVDELLSIVSNDRYDPAIDTDYFPNAVSSWFWSSSPNANGWVTRWEQRVERQFQQWQRQQQQQ